MSHLNHLNDAVILLSSMCVKEFPLGSSVTLPCSIDIIDAQNVSRSPTCRLIMTIRSGRQRTLIRGMTSGRRLPRRFFVLPIVVLKTLVQT